MPSSLKVTLHAHLSEGKQYRPTSLKVSSTCPPLLKVHKNENIFGFDFEFRTVSLLVMLKYEGFVKHNFLLGHNGRR
jgi:hypothetical protein